MSDVAKNAAEVAAAVDAATAEHASQRYRADGPEQFGDELREIVAGFHGPGLQPEPAPDLGGEAGLVHRAKVQARRAARQ